MDLTAGAVRFDAAVDEGGVGGFAHAVVRMTKYNTQLQSFIARYHEIAAKTAESRTPNEVYELGNLQQMLSGGYCLGGHLITDRNPAAYEVTYNPGLQQAPVPLALQQGSTNFWGCPNIIHRVLFSWDELLFDAVTRSGKWNGTRDELFDLIWQHRIAQPFDLPLREAIDWVNSVIYTTIKAMKFSHHLPVCGGPIEISVISTDRSYRWVKHKRFDQALG